MSDLRKIVQGTLLENEPMSRHTSYGIGGPANAYITPKDRLDLSKILKFANQHSIKTYFVGSGSNLLVADSGIDGLVLTPAKALNQLKFDGEMVSVESGVMLGRFVKECMKRNLSGVESLIGVPGTLGGALVMNAGAFGNEISKCFKSVEIMNMVGDINTYYEGDIDFAYRYSSIHEDEFVLLAQFKLISESSDFIQTKRDNASQSRKTNQPLKFRSAGSVFKNPKENAAGYLIDQAGLKGTRVGDAEISEHHANFFVNLGHAKSTDITALIRLARKNVFEKFGIKLELEVKTIGFDSKELEAYEA
jgi:UDP-N-acetylmuramate dehydrogenase